MHWQFTFALLDAHKLLFGITYRYSQNEDVYIFELGLLFCYISLALKKKEEE
jgi:hypothetical protein